MATMKEVLVLEVGRGMTRVYRFTVQDEDVQGVYTDALATWLTDPDGYIADIVSMLYRALDADANPIDVGIVTSFGDAYIHRTDTGDVPVQGRNGQRGSHGDDYAHIYDLTGTPAGLARPSVQDIRMTHGMPPWEEIVPVSTYVLSRLLERSELRVWDFTHASFTGAYNLEADKSLDAGPLEIASPWKWMGNYEGIPFLLGGMHTAFVNVPEGAAYLDTDVWWTCGRVYEAFTEELATRENYAQGIRWGRTAFGKVMGQQVYAPPDELDARGMERVVGYAAQLLSGVEQAVLLVYGSDSVEVFQKLLQSSTMKVETPQQTQDWTASVKAPMDWGFPFWVARRADDFRAAHAAAFAAQYW